MNRTALAGRLYSLITRAEARAYGLRERRVDAGDTELAVLEGGPADAPVVVLLHGYTADRVVWVRFARHLQRDHRVLIPDLAGHGATGFTAGTDFSAPAQAARVAALLDGLGVEHADVAGNSMGGFVAATLAVARPDLVRSLLLSDAVGVTSPEPSDAELVLREGRNPFLLDDVALFPEFYAMTMAKAPFVPGFIRAAIAADYVARRDELEEIFHGFFQRDTLDDRLDEIAAPTLVMWGEQDRLVHRSTARVWADGIPGARTVTYPEAGHMPMLEVPRRSAADYRAFLARVVDAPVTARP
ncbi:alpha/beta fold hydrolase [Nocardioides KLBMP 9356]|uniref:Alpha/beta fold hydrolase n=1 Tax=Nocardioides potassii TaxID=2911371 RepID=A0ABS9H5J6_9ACTN|nr:alpha/beta fold hydrolase [Nocardioides potassii]MCF6376525.1 alpha/beta fold hydrolase [Nocardioides potassii]